MNTQILDLAVSSHQHYTFFGLEIGQNSKNMNLKMALNDPKHQNYRTKLSLET